MKGDSNNPIELNEVQVSAHKPLVTMDLLRSIVPDIKSNADAFIPYLNNYMRQYRIDTPQRIAAFVAQIAHESGGFRYTTEIATGAAYEGRKDLGNLYPGDGKKFKGRGLIQVTGRANYKRLSEVFGEDFVKFPELLAAPKYAVLTACYFWQSIKGNNLADLPDTWRSNTKKYSPFQYITYRVNGGQNGYADRLKYYEKAKRELV